MDDFKGSPTALVADVDCDTEGKDLCDKVKVTGYPALKYGDPSDLKDYTGGRTYEDLKKFADENLGPTCGPANIDLCSAEDKAVIEKFQNMKEAELKAAIAEVEQQVAQITEKGEKTVKKLQAKITGVQQDIEKENKKKSDVVKTETKKVGLNMMKKVATSKKIKEREALKQEEETKQHKKDKSGVKIEKETGAAAEDKATEDTKKDEIPKEKTARKGKGKSQDGEEPATAEAPATPPSDAKPKESGPNCGPSNLDDCSDADRALIEKLMNMTKNDLKSAIDDVENMSIRIEQKSDKANTMYAKKISDLQTNIKEEQTKKASAVKEETKKLGLGMMQKVSQARRKKEADALKRVPGKIAKEQKPTDTQKEKASESEGKGRTEAGKARTGKGGKKKETTEIV